VESSLSSIILDDVEEHDSEDSFFFAEKQTPLQKIRGLRMARSLLTTNETDEWMVKKTEMNKQAQNKLYEQAQVHTKHFKWLQVFS